MKRTVLINIYTQQDDSQDNDTQHIVLVELHILDNNAGKQLS
jgi:hypothetical protein